MIPVNIIEFGTIANIEKMLSGDNDFDFHH